MQLQENKNNNKKFKVLVASIDAPFVGGAGTNSYNLIRLFKNILKYSVVGLYVYTDKKYDKDPYRTGNILSYNPLKDKLDNVKSKIVEIFSGEPDVVVSKHYIPIFYLKKIFPKIKLFLFPSGSMFYTQYINKFGLMPMGELIGKLQKKEATLHDIVNHKGKWPCYPDTCASGCDCELRAIMLAEKIVPNSSITETLYKLLYSNVGMANKLLPYNLTSALYDTSVINALPKVEFAKRKYSVIFISYSWKRDLKNAKLVEEIVNHKSMKKHSILVVGNYSNDIKIEQFNVTCLSYISNKNILEFLINSKCFVSPSFYDSYPNVVTEANLSGCNVVSSENIGQAKILNSKLVVKDFKNVEEWIQKIELGIASKLACTQIDQIKTLKEIDSILKK